MEKSSFFNAILDSNGTPDRSYLAEDFARYFATFIGNGVFPNPSNNLQIISDGTSMNIIMKAGKAWINGYFYHNTDDLILAITPADGVLNRVDRIALRLDFLERKIKAVVKKGDYASSAVAKVLQRDNDAYEIALADVAVNKGIISITQANITDLRLNKTFCGIVHGVVDQVDTTAIFNQFQSWYSTTKTNYDKDMAAWTEDKKTAFDTWYITNTSAFLNQFNTWFNTSTTKWGNDFASWFTNIKGQLDGDIAAKLTAKTIELEERLDNLKFPVESVNGKIGKVELKAEDIKISSGQTVESQLGESQKQLTELKNTKGQVNGLASLGSDGKVPNNQLPSLNYISTSDKGKANGVATLGPDSKILSEQIPDLTFMQKITEINIENDTAQVDFNIGGFRILKLIMFIANTYEATYACESLIRINNISTGYNYKIQDFQNIYERYGYKGIDFYSNRLGTNTNNESHYQRHEYNFWKIGDANINFDGESNNSNTGQHATWFVRNGKVANTEQQSIYKISISVPNYLIKAKSRFILLGAK